MRQHILIVDDDLDVLTILGLRLSRVGFAVTTATDGLIGLAALENANPCGVLLDLFMPNMGGFEFLATLRRDHATPPPVFVVTHADDGLTREHVRRLGAEQLISKGDALGRGFANALARRLGNPGEPAGVPSSNEWQRLLWPLPIVSDRLATTLVHTPRYL